MKNENERTPEPGVVNVNGVDVSVEDIYEPIIETVRIVRACEELGVMPTNNIGLHCCYQWDGKWHYLSPAGIYGVYEESHDKNKPDPVHMVEQFNEMKRNVILSYDINPNTADENDKRLKKQAMFSMNHPLCELNGKRDKPKGFNACSPNGVFWNVIIESNENKVEEDDFVKVTNAFNSMQTMSFENMVKLYWLLKAENPLKIKGMNDSKLRMLLAHPQRGIVFEKLLTVENDGNKSNLSKLMDFLKEENKASNDFRVNIKRAVEEGLIKYEKVGEQQTYLLNNQPIGISENQVIGYFMDNETAYNLHILKQLQPLKSEKVAPVKVKTPTDKENLLEKVHLLKAAGYIHNNQNEMDEEGCIEYVKMASEFQFKMMAQFPHFKTLQEVLTHLDPERKGVNAKANMNKHRKEIYSQVMDRLGTPLSATITKK